MNAVPPVRWTVRIGYMATRLDRCGESATCPDAATGRLAIA